MWIMWVNYTGCDSWVLIFLRRSLDGDRNRCQDDYEFWKDQRLDKLLLGFMQGSDFHVSLITLMFYKTVSLDAQKS